MDLFLINTTKQNWVVNIRQLEGGKSIPHSVGFGRQERVLRDATKQEVDAVLDQLREYQFPDVSDIEITRALTTLAYAFKPITSDKIMEFIETNDGYLNKRAEESLNRTAVAANATVEESVARSGASIKSLTMDIEQVQVPNTPKIQLNNRRIKVDRKSS